MWVGATLPQIEPPALPSCAVWSWPEPADSGLSPCPDYERVRSGWGTFDGFSSDAVGLVGWHSSGSSCEHQAGAFSKESSESTCWRQRSWPRRTAFWGSRASQTPTPR